MYLATVSGVCERIMQALGVPDLHSEVRPAHMPAML